MRTLLDEVELAEVFRLPLLLLLELLDLDGLSELLELAELGDVVGALHAPRHVRKALAHLAHLNIILDHLGEKVIRASERRPGGHNERPRKINRLKSLCSAAKR